MPQERDVRASAVLHPEDFEISQVVSTAEPVSSREEFVPGATRTASEDADEEEPLARLERVHPQDLDRLVVIEEDPGDDALLDQDVRGHLDRHTPEGHRYR